MQALCSCFSTEIASLTHVSQIHFFLLFDYLHAFFKKNWISTNWIGSHKNDDFKRKKEWDINNAPRASSILQANLCIFLMSFAIWHLMWNVYWVFSFYLVMQNQIVNEHVMQAAIVQERKKIAYDKKILTYFEIKSRFILKYLIEFCHKKMQANHFMKFTKIAVRKI